MKTKNKITKKNKKSKSISLTSPHLPSVCFLRKWRKAKDKQNVKISILILATIFVSKTHERIKFN